MDPVDLEAGLDAEQLEAVTTPSSPVAVLAPAGSGKTRVLTRRVAWRIATGDVEPQHVLAVTFTRRAAAELRERLRQVGLRDQVTAGTFHALALEQISDHRRDSGGRPPRILDRKRRLLADVAERSDRRFLAEVAGEIDWAKARMIPPAHYAARAAAASRRTRAQRGTIAEVYRRYEVVKRERGLLDFDDLLLEAAQLIERDGAFARAIRWRFRHLFVDEFQDINALQFRLLEAWRGDRYDLFVVGDPQQAIYTWNGSDPDLLRHIDRHYPPIRLIRLRTNYRSTPQILAGASSVLEAAGLAADDIDPTNADGELPGIHLHDDENGEARAMARMIRREHGVSRPWASFAVLVRTNAQLEPIRDALRSARIPHEVRGADAVIDHPRIRTLLDRLDEDGRPAVVALDELLATAEAGDAPSELLAELGERAGEHLRDAPWATGTELAAHLRASADRRQAAGGDSVTLATFHAAKGLEWSVVHLAGLEDGFVPISHARTREARAEEARLLYVAMTRGERAVHLHAARARTIGERTAERRISPLLAKLPTRDDTSHVDASDTLADLRSTLRAAAADPVPVELRAWRSRVARRARIPEESVVPERVLRSLARQRPTAIDELAAIDGLGPIKAARFGDELLAVLNPLPGTPSAG